MAKTRSPELTDVDRSLLSHARMLRAMGVDPVEFLGRAGFQEMRARDVKPFDVARAISRNPQALYAPRVLEALWTAASLCQRAPVGAVRRRPEVRAAVRLLRAASRALLSPSVWTRAAAARVHAEETLILAREVDAAADRTAEAWGRNEPPAETALRLVARRHEFASPAALKKRIERARKAFPAMAWPKKRARRL